MREREGVAGVEAVGAGEVRDVMEGRGEAIVDMVFKRGVGRSLKGGLGRILGGVLGGV